MAEVLRSVHGGRVDDLAQACERALGVAGVALSLQAGVERSAEPLWCHPELSAQFEELQFTLGEGPGPDAVRVGSPVVEPDLDRVRPERWPALLPAARELGVHGVCCFPLGIGAIRIGVLTLLCDSGRRLSGQQYTDATALTAVLTSALLKDDRRDGDRGGPGLGMALEFPSVLHRAVVHQATGMISVQLDVSMEEALLRLRARAYSGERPLGEIAADVVARRMRFDDDFDDDVSGPYSPDGGKG